MVEYSRARRMAEQLMNLRYSQAYVRYIFIGFDIFLVKYCTAWIFHDEKACISS